MLQTSTGFPSPSSAIRSHVSACELLPLFLTGNAVIDLARLWIVMGCNSSRNQMESPRQVQILPCLGLFPCVSTVYTALRQNCPKPANPTIPRLPAHRLHGANASPGTQFPSPMPRVAPELSQTAYGEPKNTSRGHSAWLKPRDEGVPSSQVFFCARQNAHSIFTSSSVSVIREIRLCKIRRFCDSSAKSQI